MNRDALLSYAKEAANFSTNYRLPELEFALNHRALPDVDMFDFTCMTRSENAALVREHNGARLLLGLVGDCLVEVRAVPQFPLSQQGLPDAFIALCSPSLSASRPRPHGHAPQQRKHLGVPGCRTLWWGWGRPFCIPTGDFRGGGAARLLPRRDCIGGSVWLQPWGWGGDVCPSAPRASRCLSQLSSPAKPGSSAPPPSRPDRLRGSSPVPFSSPIPLSPFSPQPFWPLGTGVARGFLAAFDAAWMVRRWAAGTPPLEVLAER